MFEWIGIAASKREQLKKWSARLRWVPVPLVYWLSAAAGWLLFWRASELRSSVQANMHRLMPMAGRRQVRRWTRRYFVNMATVLVELLWYSHQLPDKHSKRIRLKGQEHIEQALNGGKGVVLHATHCGNFFFAYWYLSQRYDCTTVATAYENELSPLYAIFEYELGVKGMDYDSTPPLTLLRTLKRHVRQNGAVYLLGDFYRPQFPATEWFGEVTRAPAGSAMLALEEGTPVVPVYSRHLGWFKHEIVCEPPIQLSDVYGPEERAEATIELNRRLERMVRLEPEQWFYWFNAHERWDASEDEDTSSEMRKSG